MKHASRLLSIVLLLTCSAHALSGPLRERIMERRAARAETAPLDQERGRKLPPGVRLVRDVAYGGDRAQRFDAYVPKDAARAPVIFMVHGGGWEHGDKKMDAVVDNKVAHWTRRGFIVISTNYRMLPEADPLAQAADVAKAIGVAQDRVADWGGARDKFVLMGHSAGAHLVSLLASSSSLQGSLRWLGVVALDSAAFDVETIMQGRHMDLYDAPFGTDPAFWRAASPYAQVQRAPQPMLAVCSTRRDAACAQARRYADKVHQLGGRVEVLEQDLSHKQINDTLGTPGTYTAAVDAFIAILLK
jgi:arylformamidase